MKCYKTELTKKLTAARKALVDYKQQCEGSSIKDDDFFEKLSKLNLLRIDVETAKSRLNNMHKGGAVVETKLIINKQ